MIRSVLAIAAGYISTIALDGFVRIIISVYHKGEITLTGIASLPSAGWIFLLVALQFAWGMFAGLLTSSIAKGQSYIEILALALLLVGAGLIDYTMLQQKESLWFLLAAPTLQVIGVLTGYYLNRPSANPQPTAIS